MKKIFYVITHKPYDTTGLFDQNENLLDTFFTTELRPMASAIKYAADNAVMVKVDEHGQTHEHTGTQASDFVRPPLEAGKELYKRLLTKLKDFMAKDCQPRYRVVHTITDLATGKEEDRLEYTVNLYHEKMGLYQHYQNGKLYLENNFYRDWYYGEHGPQITHDDDGTVHHTSRTLSKLKHTVEREGELKLHGLSRSFYPNGQLKGETMFNNYEVVWQKEYDEAGKEKEKT